MSVSGDEPVDPLLRAARRPPRDAVARLYQQHRQRLTGLASAITLDYSAAGEVVQEAFAGLTERFGSVRTPEAYLQRSVVNLSIDHVRRRERARSIPRRPLEPSSIPDIDEAWSRVAELPPQQRAVVVLRFWEDLSQEQIAAVLAIPLGTVKSTLHRALHSLKRDWPWDTEEER